MKELPDYVSFPSQAKPPLKSIFTAASDDALDLLSAMLAFNPTKRITARQVCFGGLSSSANFLFRLSSMFTSSRLRIPQPPPNFHDRFQRRKRLASKDENFNSIKSKPLVHDTFIYILRWGFDDTKLIFFSVEVFVVEAAEAVAIEGPLLEASQVARWLAATWA